MGRSEVTIKTLWGTAKSPELKLTDEELRVIVAQQTGKTSIRALNKGELARVCNHLYQLRYSAAKQKKEYRKPGTGNEATENQQKKVWMLAKNAGWSRDRVIGLCRYKFDIPTVAKLNYRQCSDLIEAMKAIITREKGEEKSEGC